MTGKSTLVFLALCFCICSHLLAVTYLVNTANNAGLGSLRDAIAQANANPGLDTIEFDMGVGGVKTITLATRLPVISDPLFIDGSSDPGYVGLPLIQIHANGNRGALNIAVTAPNTHIHALMITQADFVGIESRANYVKVSACHVGMNSDGTISLPNDFVGIGIYNSKHVQIGGTAPGEGNLISSNGGVAVLFNSSDSSYVWGNTLGTDITGSTGFGNGQGASAFNSRNIVIGGETPAHRNLISGNAVGVQFYDSNRCKIYGNYIGTDISGSYAIPNVRAIYIRGDSNIIGGFLPGQGNLISGNSGIGVNIYGNAPSNISSDYNSVYGNIIGTDILGSLALPNQTGIYIGQNCKHTTIGGSTANHRNLVSGNARTGIQLSLVDSTFIYGNYIGTNLTGTSAIANQTHGIGLSVASHTFIGDGTLAAANIISGNAENGISMNNGNDSSYIQHNYVGTDLSGLLNIANGRSGIYVRLGSVENIIGGLNPGEGNIIANNLSNGIEISGTTAIQNQILGNSIYDHANPGIVLSGGNNLQEAPDLTGFAGGVNITVSGVFNSAPNTTYRLEFFTSPTAEQGKTFIGASTITTDAVGFYALNETFAATINAGEPILTATATDPNGNTSAFGSETVLGPDLVDELEGRNLTGSGEISWVFENPVNSLSEIRMSAQSETYATVVLFSLNGKKVSTLFDGKLFPSQTTSFGLRVASSLPKGIYLLVFEGEQFREVRKVFIQNR